jgi:hypothetical protein
VVWVKLKKEITTCAKRPTLVVTRREFLAAIPRLRESIDLEGEIHKVTDVIHEPDCPVPIVKLDRTVVINGDVEAEVTRLQDLSRVLGEEPAWTKEESTR